MATTNTLSLSRYSFCFSVSPRRVSLLRKLFAAQGLAMPRVRAPYIVSTATRRGEPRAYSGLALTFIEALQEAHRKNYPYVVLFEDDAAPCPEPQKRLTAYLQENPLPKDCGILTLGDMNGVSRVRGKQTLLLNDCEPIYTPLVPGKAENKGSHAMVVFRDAIVPYIQAIIENGVTDLATSRISRYGELRAYAMFHNPLFAQHRIGVQGRDSLPVRTPEMYYGRESMLKEAFPLSTPLTGLTAKHPVGRFFVLSNAKEKNIERLDIHDDDVVVLLNKGVDFEAVKPYRKMLICRRNAGKREEWFIPEGQAYTMSKLYEDYLIPTDEELSAERAWFRDYKAQTGKQPTTGWIAWKLLQDDFPTVPVVLVDFDPDGDVGTYKWPKHDWSFEARDYARAHATIVSTRADFDTAQEV